MYIYLYDIGMYAYMCMCVCVYVCAFLMKKSLQPPVSRSGLPIFQSQSELFVSL